MQNQGVKIAVFVMCFSLSVNLIGAVGISNQLGIQRDTGLGGQSVAKDTNAPDPGGGLLDQASSLLRLVVVAAKTILTLGGILTGTQAALVALDVKPEIALYIQLVLDVGFALGVAAFFRGVRL